MRLWFLVNAMTGMSIVERERGSSGSTEPGRGSEGRQGMDCPPAEQRRRRSRARDRVLLRVEQPGGKRTLVLLQVSPRDPMVDEDVDPLHLMTDRRHDE
jgi:hypothetical protein